MSLRIQGFRLLCRDVAATASFYETTLDAAARSSADGNRTLGLGHGTIELAPGIRRAAPAPSNATAFQHLAIIVSDMDAAMGRLGAATGWTPISRNGPERLPESSGGVTAFKFRDPEGHPLEFLAFPRETCPAIWRGRKGLFLGIDHSAITVADVEASVAFYEALGFSVASRQINRGIEQERMDDVEGAVVDVVGLTPPGEACPHLELLHYREPGTMPEPAEDDDVRATRVLLRDEQSGHPSDLVDLDGHRLSFDNPAQG